jgi:hypothetical protein
MYFIINVFIAIIFFAIIFLNLIKLILKPNQERYQKLLNIIVYIIAFATLINIIIATYSFFSTKDKIAAVGDRGIRGPKGENGRSGICDDKCGQKVCYVSVIEHADNVFNNKMKQLKSTQQNNGIANAYFKNKINEICSSEKYSNMIVQKLKKKITEKKLIEYIKKIVEEWVLLFIKYDPDNKGSEIDQRLGVIFLNEKHYTPELLNKDGVPSPITELEQYDIFTWGDKDYYSQKKIEIQSNNIEYPIPDDPKMFIMKTNNYERVYTSKMKPDKWKSDEYLCNYNQMGQDNTNPKKLKRCIYINPNNQMKEYRNTWKTEAFNDSSDLSIYNVKPFKNDNNQIFYPVGSVWSGKINEDDTKKSYADRLPKSKNYCGEGHGVDGSKLHTNKGPVKETILVSGDVVDPEDFTLIWESDKGCPDCQDFNNKIKIYRPVPPKGYISLGDVAAKSKDDAKKLEIKCVPKKYIKKMRMGPMVWNNKNVKYSKFNNYDTYTQNKPYFFNKPISMTLWSAGASNIFEENKNNINIDLEDDGGYNLFRINAGKGFNAKLDDMHSYKIIDKYLLYGNGKTPTNLKLPINVGVTDKRYSDQMYFNKKPPGAILTNNTTITDIDTKSINGFNKKPKRLYLMDDGNKHNKDKSDTYFIKTYNPLKNDYSSCITTGIKNDGSGYVSVSNRCDNSNNNHIWKVKHDKSGSLVSVADVNIETLADFSTGNQNKCLQHHYDSLGKSVYSLGKCDDDNMNMKYSTFIEAKLPII